MSEFEQFLMTTMVARMLFVLLKALKSARDAASLENEIGLALGFDANNNSNGLSAEPTSCSKCSGMKGCPILKTGSSAEPMSCRTLMLLSKKHQVC